MPYPFDQIFAADPERPEMVAVNAPVVVFAPGDETKTPLKLTAVNGLPLGNPVMVNDRGFGPAFIADLDQVAWEGGGLTGLMASYRGLKDDAEAARLEASLSRAAAEEAARNAGAPTAEAVASELAEGRPANTAVKEVAAAAAETSIAPVREAVTDAADPLAYLNRIRHIVTVPARPEGLLWPQAFSTNPDEGHLYVCYSGAVGESGPAASVVVYTLDGALISSKSVTVQDGTASEGLPWFRNGSGHLCFILRPATAGRGYAIFNYDTGVLGPVIQLPGGNYKSAVSGDFFYTVDANDSTNGFGKLFVYTWASIKAGVPELVQTIPLASRNRMEKVQSFTVNGGVAVFNHGASKSRIYLSAYNLAGDLQTAYEMDKPGFARAVNRDAPGTIANPNSYRHESEGAWTHEGKTWTGHIVDDNNSDYKFVIVEHNRVDGVHVEPRPVPVAHDTDWAPLELRAPAVTYVVGTEPRVRRDGKTVFVDGAVKGLPASPVDVVVGNVGPQLAPSRQLELPLQISSGGAATGWKIRPNGDLLISRTQVTGSGPETWYPFSFFWPVG